jgi:hypothetical protein
MFTFINLQNFVSDSFNISNNIFIILHSLQDFFSIIISQLNNNLVLDIILVGSIISLSSRAGKILDTAQKFATTLTAATIAYKNMIDSGDDKNKDKDKDKDKDKKDKKDDKDKDNKDDKDNTKSDNNNESSSN